ncbi:unnamed protein product [Paramecium sonneborni]|uniref:C2H2-type domain-containing protein n=1 Tax=Paramecium sonneborni TaxID=65129 RepID=A0A8S1NXI6_9CILI|nr:unnamed protein product [Paramecium sonneborni]
MLLIICILISGINSLQGLVSVGRAIKTQQQINYYLGKYHLSLNMDLIDLKEYKDFDDITNLRYASKCEYCNKTFKNSSYLQMHQYNKHFDDNLKETIIILNYICEFTNCLKSHGSNSLQALPKNVRIQKCLKFANLYVNFSVLELQNLNKFCDDLVLDELDPFYQETPYWDAFMNIVKTIGITIYIFGSLYIIKKIQDYVSFLQRKHKRTQPKNYKEKYNVM